jgi:hypothetical protein
MSVEDKTTGEPINKIQIHQFKPKRTLKQRIKEFFQNPKKRLIFLIVLSLIILGLFYLGLRFLTAEKNTSKTGGSNEEDRGPKTQAPLDGLMVSQTAASRHPLAVIVENHPDARPQAGLDKASVIYEAIAEGGITRFMAIYGTNEADKIGPVRSARTYFVDWARGYDAYLAHVGGNIDALDQIRSEKVLDLDQFGNPGPYWREKNKNLASEHTMYTATTKLRKVAEDKKYSTANNFTVYKFKDDPTETEKAALPVSQQVTVNFSSDQYKVVYDWDKTSNLYKRTLAGKAHVDQITKNQLAPKNLIIMTVNRKSTVTRINEAGYSMTTIGSGAAKIFLDGKMIEATWKKTSKSDREIFYDKAGNEIVFNRGQFWIEVLPPEAIVSVQ